MINDKKWNKEKINYIYILFEKNNLENIKYVGKTSNCIKKRLNDHISLTKKKVKRNINLTYKENWLNFINYNVDIKIIDQEKNWEKAESLEKYYIKMFKEKNYKLTNSTIGGDGATPKYKSDNNNAKKTLQYDLDGNFIQEFLSRKDAEEKTGIKAELISSCCTMKRIRSAGGFIWTNYIENYPLKINSLLQDLENLKNKYKIERGKKILQFSLDGILLNEYVSLREMERQTGYLRQSIRYAINNNVNTHGFIWKDKTF
jgi:hypothetical protein